MLNLVLKWLCVHHICLPDLSRSTRPLSVSFLHFLSLLMSKEADFHLEFLLALEEITKFLDIVQPNAITLLKVAIWSEKNQTCHFINGLSLLWNVLSYSPPVDATPQWYGTVGWSQTLHMAATHNAYANLCQKKLQRLTPFKISYGYCGQNFNKISKSSHW